MINTFKQILCSHDLKHIKTLTCSDIKTKIEYKVKLYECEKCKKRTKSGNIYYLQPYQQEDIILWLKKQIDTNDVGFYGE